MRILRPILALLLSLWLPAYSFGGGTVVKGSVKVRGSVGLQAAQQISSPFFATLPQFWANAGLSNGTGDCSPPGGVFDATKTMPGDYAATFAGLRQAKIDQNVANQWWLLKITAGTNIHGSTFDGDNALISWPYNTSTTKCLVVQSSTHNTDAQIVCAKALPGFGGPANTTDLRNAENCVWSGKNDAANMWKLTIDSTPANGNIGMNFGSQTPGGGHASYILVEDMEIAPAPGSAQSKQGVNVTIQVSLNGGDHVFLAYDWIHGWNPGDAGQPGAGSGNAAVDNTTGVCLAWNKSGGTVNTSGTTVTWVSGPRFGFDFSDGTHSPGFPQALSSGSNALIINGTSFTIASHDPAASDTTLTLATSAGTQTAVPFTLQNPATQYNVGCGDDSRAVQASCTNCAIEYSMINKIHWWNNEAHDITAGFSNGPVQIAANWLEPAGGGVFSGGGDVDIRGGPQLDLAILQNFIGRDLNWRFLSASAGKSPAPPFGCGPLDGNSAHDTCPFNWGIKNNIELKQCNRCLIWANILDGVWADGQTGYLFLITARAASGGETAGIYDPVTGLPMTILQNIRVQDTWVRNAPQLVQISSRALSPGNGGGISGPVFGMDWVNVLGTNVGDHSEFGNPGPDLFQWAASGEVFNAVMSRTSGVAHAVVAANKIANYDPGLGNVGVFSTAFDISSVIRSGTVVTMKLNGLRHDPVVGGNIVVANASGWNGTFTITGTLNTSSPALCNEDINGVSKPSGSAAAVQPQPCVKSDGTFGDTITYTDSQGGSSTLCSTKAACDATGIQGTLDTHAYQITDISVGDGVYTHNCTGGSSPTSYQVGATSRVQAVSPTNPAGLDVYYLNAGSDDNTGATTCQIENSSGWPANVSVQKSTFLTSGIMSVGSNGQAGQHYKNQFFSNVFGMPAGSNVILACGGIGGQGTATYVCWDRNTFEFFDNIILDPASVRAAQWTVAPGGSPVNFFPTTVTCSGALGDPTCMGYTSYMSGVSFNNATCSYDGSNPLNCPLMAAPWSSNFSLSSISPVVTSSYRNEGIDVTKLTNAFTASGYTCPVGVSCGTGPKVF